MCCPWTAVIPIEGRIVEEVAARSGRRAYLDSVLQYLHIDSSAGIWGSPSEFSHRKQPAPVQPQHIFGDRRPELRDEPEDHACESTDRPSSLCRRSLAGSSRRLDAWRRPAPQAEHRSLSSFNGAELLSGPVVHTPDAGAAQEKPLCLKGSSLLVYRRTTVGTHVETRNLSLPSALDLGSDLRKDRVVRPDCELPVSTMNDGSAGPAQERACVCLQESGLEQVSCMAPLLRQKRQTRCARFPGPGRVPALWIGSPRPCAHHAPERIRDFARRGPSGCKPRVP